MFPIASLTTFLLLAVSVATNPIVVRKSPVSLPLARHFDITSGHNLVKRDQARAKNLFSTGKAKRSGIFEGDPISIGVSGFTTVIGIGEPPTNNTVFVDTASANTLVGLGEPYIPTSTSVNTGETVSQSIGSTKFFGAEFNDTVTIDPNSGLVITDQPIGVASQPIPGVTLGILGLGPRRSSLGTLSPSTNATIPTVTDSLFSQGTIQSDVVSISLEPMTSSPNQIGALTFGGTDDTQYIGPITYTSVTTISPANEFWGINQSVDYGSSTLLSSNSTAIFDTGSELILLAPDAFETYISQIGAICDSSPGFCFIAPDKYDSLQSLFFGIGDSSFELTANAQIWPRALNSQIGGTDDKIYLAIQSLPTSSGEGPDCVLGRTFLERFYTIYDTTDNRVGVANTQFTTATTN